MKKVIIAPDSFKGALTAGEATDIIATTVREFFSDCKIVKMPIADGGEGSVDAVLSAIGGEVVKVEVQSPDNRIITATYGISDNGTAVIEMAQSSGITRQMGLNPMTSNTYGFGQLILDALARDVRAFTLCIGGSATTDGGTGMASALGVRFSDKLGSTYVPCGETLCDIAAVDVKDIDERVAGCSFTVMCDVDNPLYGENGAAYVYGPQKGANPEQVQILDAGLRHYEAILFNQFGQNYNETPGAGAAGGLGAGCMAFLGAKLMSGIDAILKLCEFEKHLDGADLIITGEGKLDSQSFYGKVLSGIKRDAQGVPVWSICGVCECDVTLLHEHGITVFETSEGVGAEESISDAAKHLRQTARRAMQKAKEMG